MRKKNWNEEKIYDEISPRRILKVGFLWVSEYKVIYGQLFVNICLGILNFNVCNQISGVAITFAHSHFNQEYRYIKSTNSSRSRTPPTSPLTAGTISTFPMLPSSQKCGRNQSKRKQLCHPASTYFRILKLQVSLQFWFSAMYFLTGFILFFRIFFSAL